MLLYPLALEPEWWKVDGSSASVGSDGRAVLYYGSGSPPRSSWIHVPLDPASPRFFREARAYEGRPPGWLFDGNAKVPVLFGGPRDGGDRRRARPTSCTWDFIASAFFWLSRWQEYTVRRRDRHGRFPYGASLQKRWGTADYPPVEIYRRRLSRALEAAGVRVGRRRWGSKSWAFAPTHDLDYARKWRSGIIAREMLGLSAPEGTGANDCAWLRRAGTAAGQLLRGRDPYRESLRRILEEERTRGVGATYFLKAGAHGPRDVSYTLDRGFVKAFLENARDGVPDAGSRAGRTDHDRRDASAGAVEIGLHPGYHAFDHPGRYRSELNRLRRVAGGSVRSVRHHYLRSHDPASARIQEAIGVAVDASLGWPDREGFRAGTCLPFLYFDCRANTSRPIWQVPLTLMDSAMIARPEIDRATARSRTDELLGVCRRFGGLFCGLWHEMIYDPIDGAGWGRHFEVTLDRALEHGATADSLGVLLERYLSAPVASAATTRVTDRDEND